MKKRTFLYFIPCLLVLKLHAQVILPELKGKKIFSKVSFAKKQFQDGIDNDRLKMEYTRFLEIKADKKIDISIKRIRQKNKTEVSSIDIDTDKPFPNNEYEKGIIEHYTNNIDKTVKIDLEKRGNKSLTHKMWLAQLPAMNKIGEFSGIFIDKNNSILSWTDTLMIDNQVFINRYSTDSTNNVVLKGEGKPYKKNEVKVDDSNSALPPMAGTNVQAESAGKTTSYTFQVSCKQNTNFIEKIVGKIITSETLIILGQKHERNTNDFILVENKYLE